MNAVPMDVSPTVPDSRAAPVTGLVLAISLGLLLGLAVQGGLLLVLAARDELPQSARLFADAAQLMSGTLLACIALVVSRAAGRAHPALALLPGLLLMPVAVVGARALQIETLAALTGRDIHGALPWAAAAVQGVAFALLGGLLCLLARQRAGGFAQALAGAGIGALACAALGPSLPDGAATVPEVVTGIAVPAGAAAVAFLVGRLAHDSA